MRQLLLLVGGALLLAGCTSGPGASLEPSVSGDIATGSAFSTAPGLGSEPAPYEFTTTIHDGSFQHTRLDAFTDATIRWWNVGDETHSVVSDDGQFAGSGPIAPGDEYEHTFLTAGDYTFHCRYHPDMKGIVVVR